MLCMLFLERLGLFHCFRKHEGFLSLLETVLCACAGNGDLRGELGRFWEGAGGCFRSELCQLLLPLCFWHCGSVELHEWGTHHSQRNLPWNCTLVTSLWEFFQVDQRISTFFWDAWWPSWSCWAAQSEQSWANPILCLAEASGFPLDPSLLQTSAHRAWKARKGQVPTARAFWV